MPPLVYRERELESLNILQINNFGLIKVINFEDLRYLSKFVAINTFKRNAGYNEMPVSNEVFFYPLVASLCSTSAEISRKIFFPDCKCPADQSSF